MSKLASLRRKRPAGIARPKLEIDLPTIENAVRQILIAVGEDVSRDGLLNTPKRVARMYAELLGGLREDPAVHLTAAFTERYDEMVVLRDISFNSMCEHHLLPFVGKAHVAYLPRGRVIGVSKLARVIDVLARRPQVQERLTSQIADLLMQRLEAIGVGVILEAHHTCMTVRGVKKPGSIMVTSAMRGTFKNNLATRSEAINLMIGRAGRMD
ncbi:MAG: GTP cyclohydrolase I FolE [Phycisphaerae bacterium]